MPTGTSTISPGAFNGVAFLNAAIFTEDHDPDVVGLKVQGHPFNTAREFDHLTSLDIIKAIDTSDPVTDGENLTNFGGFCLSAEIGDLIF